LVAPGPDAESWYLESIERLQRTPLRTELARAQLLYGEWLRREGRRIDARSQLGAAHAMFAGVGAEGFEERARRELLATGERVRKRSVQSEASEPLTPQEESIARLARDGRSNSAIAAELFVSPRTVEWHLRKVFMKLGITSRKELENVLPVNSRRLHSGHSGLVPPSTSVMTSPQ
jgi:DNA-binding CsgD family transcriptional regulator